MIKELIVVEGKKDAEIVKRAFPQADVLITHGWGLTQAQIEALKTAQRRRGVIVLTDPDRAGEMIRRRLSRLLPGCGHAFIPRNKAIKDGKVGVEAARVEDVYHSLQVRSEGAPRGEFGWKTWWPWPEPLAPASEGFGGKLSVGWKQQELSHAAKAQGHPGGISVSPCRDGGGARWM